MNKNLKQILIFFFIISFLILPFLDNIVFANNGNNFPYQHDDDVIVNALNYLRNKQKIDGNIGSLSVSAWAAMAITAADNDPNDWGNLVNYLETKTTLLETDKATDWERHALAIVACNEDPRDFAGVDFVEKIINFFDGTQFDDPANLYDDYFGIISLISAGIDKNESIITKTKSYIIDKQKTNGGWGDADSTAAAILALVLSGENKNSQVINNAFSFLKTLQANNGGFKSWGITNSASTSWVVMAINAAERNPTSNEWKKNGNDPINYLVSLQQDDGSFNWSNDQKTNPEWMTSYVIPALLGKFYPVKIYNSGGNENFPPNQPYKPTGPSEGKIGVIYEFKTYCTDPDEDRIQYRFDWDANGDHIYSSWTTFKKSGYSVSLSKKWTVPGTYRIKSQSRDEHGLTSTWSEGHKIKIKENFEWSGKIRIEGKNNTIWQGSVMVDKTFFYAVNKKTDEIEEYNINFPSVLGALIEAADIAGFSLLIEHQPDTDTFYIKSIENESDWWHCWVDYQLIQIETEKYRLTEEDDEILFGYLESLEAHSLNINIDKKIVKKNEEFTVSVFDEQGYSVKNASVYIGSYIFFTGNDGNVTINISDTGNFIVYSEKDGFIRSNKETIKISKDIEIIKPTNNALYFANFKIKENLKNTWIIGIIEIEVESSDKVEKVEFYINENLEHTDEKRPFKYKLNNRIFFKKTKITVKSYICKDFGNVFINLVRQIRKLLEKNEIDKIFELIKKTMNDMQHNNLIEGDCEIIVPIIINLYPKIQKKLYDINFF
jgi:hypothetical protein